MTSTNRPAIGDDPLMTDRCPRCFEPATSMEPNGRTVRYGCDRHARTIYVRDGADVHATQDPDDVFCWVVYLPEPSDGA